MTLSLTFDAMTRKSHFQIISECQKPTAYGILATGPVNIASVITHKSKVYLIAEQLYSIKYLVAMCSHIPAEPYNRIFMYIIIFKQ